MNQDNLHQFSERCKLGQIVRNEGRASLGVTVHQVLADTETQGTLADTETQGTRADTETQGARKHGCRMDATDAG